MVTAENGASYHKFHFISLLTYQKIENKILYLEVETRIKIKITVSYIVIEIFAN